MDSFNHVRPLFPSIPPENFYLRFSDVFREYRNGTLAWMGWGKRMKSKYFSCTFSYLQLMWCDENVFWTQTLFTILGMELKDVPGKCMFQVWNRKAMLMHWSIAQNVFRIKNKDTWVTLIYVVLRPFVTLNTFSTILQYNSLAFLFLTLNMHFTL